jgi:peptide/nickel transport system substrate-binding protein
MLDPALNQSLRTNGDAAWFGWPADDKLEALRIQWMRSTDSEARQEIAAAIQERAFEVVPYIPTGLWKRGPPTARTSRARSLARASSNGVWIRFDPRRRLMRGGFEFC